MSPYQFRKMKVMHARRKKFKVNSKCTHKNVATTNSRPSLFDTRIRRKECLKCGFRWNTFEVKEDTFVTLFAIAKEYQNIKRIPFKVSDRDMNFFRTKRKFLNA